MVADPTLPAPLGRVINQYPHALAPQCGWMREGGRSQ